MVVFIPDLMNALVDWFLQKNKIESVSFKALFKKKDIAFLILVRYIKTLVFVDCGATPRRRKAQGNAHRC